MRSTLSHTLAAVLLTAVASIGCTDDKPGDADAKPQIALIMKSLANEFFSTMASGARRHQEEHSSEYELIVNGIKDERDLSRQVGLVEEMIARRVTAIVIAPADSKALIPVLKRAMAEGIVVVNIDNKLDATVLADVGIRVPFVGPDNRAGARKVAAELALHLSQGDHVVVLEGVRTSFNGQQRRLGFEDAMKAAGIEIVDSQSAQWEMNIANQTAAAMISEHGDLKAILAANDNMALGALAAVKAAGKAGKVSIVGFDNIQGVQKAIRGGEILATADQHGDRLAVFGIEYALQIAADRKTAEGSKIPDDRETPVDLITAEDLP